jgi:type IX secretion system substrate protein
MRKYIIIIALFVPVLLGADQETISEVIQFQPGEGQNVGQGSEYFPANIFGLPSTNASETTQVADPYEVLSIGMGGEIVVGFGGAAIRNIEGPDFVIFENAFLNPLTKKIFAEPAQISVSQDGFVFYDFPFDSLTLKGCAGITPTYGDQDPFDPSVSGGDKFDIADLGLEMIRYIKIKDITPMVKNNKEHPYYDVILSGFDLDAVLAYELEKTASVEIVNNSDDLVVYSNDNECRIKLENSKSKSFLSIFDLLGKKVYESQFVNEIIINGQVLQRGFYIINIRNEQKIWTKKVIID